jgi:hypothetical protein
VARSAPLRPVSADRGYGTDQHSQVLQPGSVLHPV